MGVLLDIKERMSIFKNFYDEIRVVDPINNKVFSDEFNSKINDNLNKKECSTSNCYDVWGKKSMCSTCISKKAYLKNDTFMKLEYNQKNIFLVLASPIEIEERKYVVEILKDITNNGEIVEGTGETDYLDLTIKTMGENLVKDYLTGVYNKRYIDQRFSKEANRNLKESIPTTVIMTDIDSFKRVNDTYGHLIGDKILRDFAKVLNNNIRENSDWIGRYGGEEFIIVLNNTNMKNGVKVAEKLRKIIEKMSFDYDEISVKITASFGVCEVSEKEDPFDTIKNADEKLYMAKMAGRNKTVF
ncbi:TPA: GGDEF domain-containing protein [Clostridium perfringens]|uniref:Diguanylate cyclase n=1 Tax=Clostridium perfringens TaxID=1502 RepID=A0A127EK22_CLOPF|nr:MULTISPECIES: GGDEF domain-containing protein [Clostridium]AMN36299.1 diguanylate cyclase [Clostridium perfringens]EGT3604961.1 GGDEF domain-containing protein [Clostridium perfringens]EGT4137038.1 GGDEF domain-containing protein [Clostridium perfringens]EGT4142841.1 GGDEF domain-containing protein [Clostridium perfringens]EIW6612990.1 GGDEF domain-containing protein [Clostridium perfringens]